MMSSKTTVAVSFHLRKTIKKLAALLDVSQGEIIEQAIIAFEKNIISSNQALETDIPAKRDSRSPSKLTVKEILKEATRKVWAADPERKVLQSKLMEGPETIDDFIIRKWHTGLEEIDDE